MIFIPKDFHRLARYFFIIVRVIGDYNSTTSFMADTGEYKYIMLSHVLEIVKHCSTGATTVVHCLLSV